MVSHKFDFGKKSAFLLTDAPPAPKKNLSTRFPAINHILAHSYALALDSLLDFNDPDKDAKVVSSLYVKLFAHTAKHLIHKYNRHGVGEYRFKIWGLYDFMNKQGKNYSYVEYPRTEDLCSLKREVMNRTSIKVKSLDMDMALQNINEGASNDFKDYYMVEFQPDFEQAHLFWTVMINFMATKSEGAENAEMSSNIEDTIQTLISLEQTLTEPEFICEIESLLNSNLEIFETGEQSIQCFEVFQQFSRLLDRQLQAFIEKTGAVEEAVFASCKSLYEQDQSALTCFEYIIAAGDYNDFLEMMLTRRELLQWRSAEEESSPKTD